jgi:hypothetical protein
VFDFRDKNGRTGTLTLPMPDTISIFEVDPRTDPKEGGTGPRAYKEWIVTAKAGGTGIFAAGLRGNARVSLILHGSGNSCTGPRELRPLDAGGERTECGLHLHRRAGALAVTDARLV